MGCLFCDQTPESVGAREKLAKICVILGTTNPIRAVERLIAALQYEKMHHEQLQRDRDQWRHECENLKKYITSRQSDSRMLPDHYTDRDRTGRMRYTPSDWNPVPSKFWDPEGKS